MSSNNSQYLLAERNDKRKKVDDVEHKVKYNNEIFN